MYNSLTANQLLDDLLNEDNEITSEIPTIEHIPAVKAPAVTSKGRKKGIPNVKAKITEAYRKIVDLTTEQSRKDFATEDIFGGERYNMFTEPSNTTNTLEAFIDGGVNFHEKELIKYIKTTPDIHACDCNYGHIRSSDYVEKVVPVKSTRGRKKKAPPANPRKPQGDGSSFNSQVTFLVKNPNTFGPVYFRIKVFRTGKLQIPGVSQLHINAIYQCINFVKDQLYDSMHHMNIALGLPAMSVPLNIAGITPVMKNYKFAIIHRNNQVLRLDQLKKILMVGTPKDCPKIVHVKYSAQEPSKLSVEFLTPIPGKPNKQTRVNIFISGRVNILGAFKVEHTQKICEYLHEIVETNRLVLMGTVGVPFASNFTSSRLSRWLRLILEAALSFEH